MAVAEAPWLKDIAEGVMGRVSQTDSFPVCTTTWIKEALEVGKLVTICTHDPEAPLQFWAGIVCGQGIRILNSDFERIPPEGSLILDGAKWREFVNLSGQNTALIGKAGAGKTFLSKLLLQTHLDRSHHRQKKEKVVIFDTTGEFTVPWSEAPAHKGFILRSFANRLAIFSNHELEVELELRKVAPLRFDFREFTPLQMHMAFHPSTLTEQEWLKCASLSREDWNKFCEKDHKHLKDDLAELLKLYHLPDHPLKINLIGSLLNPSIDAVVLDMRDIAPQHRKSFVQFITSVLEDHNEQQILLPVKEEDEFFDVDLSSGAFSAEGLVQVYRDDLRCLLVQDVIKNLKTRFPTLQFFEREDDCVNFDNRIFLFEGHRCSFISKDFKEELLFETFENVIGKTLLETIPLRQSDSLQAIKAELASLGLKSERDIVAFFNSSLLQKEEEKLGNFLRFLNSSILGTSIAGSERMCQLNPYLLALLEKNDAE